jgi:hypothetical protein
MTDRHHKGWSCTARADRALVVPLLEVDGFANGIPEFRMRRVLVAESESVWRIAFSGLGAFRSDHSYSAPFLQGFLFKALPHPDQGIGEGVFKDAFVAMAGPVTKDVSIGIAF